jgi:DNA-binding NarL/FixJ family response regulator
MRALVIADSGPAMADLTRLLLGLKNIELRHASGRTDVSALVGGFAPDLVLVDEMHWPRLALARLDEVHRAAPSAAIVVLAERLEGGWLADALRKGAAAVVPAGVDADTFRQVLDDVHVRVPAAA